jgi:hypothetical protein
MWPEHELYDIACMQHEEQLRRAGDRRLVAAVRRSRRIEPTADAATAGIGRHHPWETAMAWRRRLIPNAGSLRSSDPRKA